MAITIKKKPSSFELAVQANFKQGQRVKVAKSPYPSYPLYNVGDTGTVLKMFTADGMHDQRPGCDVYLVKMDKPKERSEVHIHHRDLVGV